MNPYWESSFFSFIMLFLQRVWALITGVIPVQQVASDELQIAALCCIGISAAVLGPFLVLKKMTMLANALSHTSLLGIAMSCMLLPMQGSFSTSIFVMAAIITALLTVGFTEMLKKVFKVHEEASIGLVFTFLFALGVVFVTVFLKNAHLGVEAIMGNIDAIHGSDVAMGFYVAATNCAIIAALFPYYKICAFDETLARSQGCAPKMIALFLMLQTAFTTISAFRAVGVFLFLIFLTAPVLAARLLSSKLKTILWIVAAINCGCALIGVALARHVLSVYDTALSTGAVTATCVALSYPITQGLMTFKQHLFKKRLQHRKHT